MTLNAPFSFYQAAWSIKALMFCRDKFLFHIIVNHILKIKVKRMFLFPIEVTDSSSLIDNVFNIRTIIIKNTYHRLESLYIRE